MRLLSKTAYVLQQSLLNLMRYPVHASIGILSLSVSLILVGLIGLFLWKADGVVNRLSGGLRLTVYLEPDMSQGAVEDLVRVIRQHWAEAQEVEYHSAAEDRERNLKLLPEDVAVEMDSDLIPAQPYLEVILQTEGLDDKRVQEMSQWFNSLPDVQGVDDILFGAEKIASAYSLLRGARTLGIFIGAVVLLASLFFVLVTTRLIVEGRREEIEVLLLVGATKRFVRIPHYLEGIIQGTLAGLVAYSVVWTIQHQMMAHLRGGLMLQVPLDLLPVGVETWFVLGGVGLGFLGSYLGVMRYLKVSR